MGGFVASHFLDKKLGIRTPLSFSPIGRLTSRILDKNTKKKKRAFVPVAAPDPTDLG